MELVQRQYISWLIYAILDSQVDYKVHRTTETLLLHRR